MTPRHARARLARRRAVPPDLLFAPEGKTMDANLTQQQAKEKLKAALPAEHVDKLGAIFPQIDWKGLLGDLETLGKQAVAAIIARLLAGLA